jgi:hypothetical protein
MFLKPPFTPDRRATSCDVTRVLKRRYTVRSTHAVLTGAGPLLLCAQAGHLYRITPRSPLYAPLPHPTPFSSFKSLSIAASGFTQKDKRDTIHRLVVLLGATFCTGLKKTYTHLIVPHLGTLPGDSHPTPSGNSSLPANQGVGLVEKVQAAQAWGLCIVSSDWLLECAHAGRRLQEKDFLPPGEMPPPRLPGATQMMGVSQLPATQVRGSLGQSLLLMHR